MRGTRIFIACEFDPLFCLELVMASHCPWLYFRLQKLSLVYCFSFLFFFNSFTTFLPLSSSDSSHLKTGLCFVLIISHTTSKPIQALHKAFLQMLFHSSSCRLWTPLLFPQAYLKSYSPFVFSCAIL